MEMSPEHKVKIVNKEFENQIDLKGIFLLFLKNNKI